MTVGLAAAGVEEKGEGGGGDFFHIAEVAAEAIGAAMAKEIGGEDGVAPRGVAETDLLEHPAGVGAVAVSHVDGAFGLWRVQRNEALREELAMGGFEEGFGVLNSL